MPDLSAAETTTSNLKGVVQIIEPDRHEQGIARRSAEVRAVVPSMEFSAVADMDATLTREDQVGCGLVSLLISAVAKSLRSVPRVNGSYRDGHYELYSRVNIGVTIIEEGVYTTPTVFDADAKTPVEIAAELAGLYERAREGELHPSELAGATFTVIDSIAYDIAALSPMIIAPQAGALAAGPVRDTPVVRAGQVVAGRTMALTLAVDHRIVYGWHAAAFLEEIKAHLEEAPA